MITSEPQATQYDLNFTLLGVPVRVHPLFWFFAAILGMNLREPMLVAMWVAVVFVSIVVHEFGHVLAFRYFGIPSYVVLHSFGGLAIPRRAGRWSTWEQIAISAAGPAAGFALVGVMLLFLKLGGMQVELDYAPPINFGLAIGGLKPRNLRIICFLLFEVNIYWGIMNLLPVFPLDGGQIARAILEHSDRRSGLVKSLWLSIYVAALVAVYAFFKSEDQFLGIMFCILAYSNYQVLQAIQGRGGW